MRTIGLAAIFIAISFTVLCCALIAAFSFLPGLGINWYSSIWMYLVPVSPLLFSRFTVNRLFEKLRRALTGLEHIAFAALLVALIFSLAVLCESGIIYIIYGKEYGLSLTDIVMAPFHDRYTLSGLSGFSFAVTALYASGLTGLVFIPMRLRLLSKNARVE